MSDVQQYLIKFERDKTAAEVIARKTAKELESKRTTLIDVVKSLGDYINDENSQIRSNAVTYLSQVIGALSRTILSKQQVQILCQFFCDRIDDGGAIAGLHNLQLLAAYTSDMAIMTFRAVTKHFQDFMLHQRARRQEILGLLNDLMLNHRPAIKGLGDEAVIGVTDLVSGEKDPRNLMIVFSILRVLIVEWEISQTVQKLFDAVFCYFPITFRPSSDDSHALTVQDLKVRLRDCIAASSLFAPYALPQLVDKLDSTSLNVKKDVLKTIGACASAYDPSVISNYSVTLWDALKYELLNVQDEELAQEALIVLQAIALRLKQDLASTTSMMYLARYLKPVTEECLDQLKEPQHKQAKPVGDIIQYVGSTSIIAYHLIVKAILPPLITMYQDASGIARRRAFLEVLIQIFSAAIALGQVSRTAPFQSNSDDPLQLFKSSLFDIFTHTLMGTSSAEVSYRLVALKGLVRLCQISGFLEDSDITLAVQHFDEIVLLDQSDEWSELKIEAIQALVEISKLKPNIVMDISFPFFLATLPDSDPSDDTAYLDALEGLARLSVEKTLSDVLVRRLLNKLEVVLQASAASKYPQAILATLHFVLSRRELVQDSLLQTCYERVVLSLVRQAALASLDSKSSSALTDMATLEILGRLVGTVVKALDEQKRQTIALESYTLFAEKDALYGSRLMPSEIPYKQCQTTILSTWILASVGSSAEALYTTGDHSGLPNLLQDLMRAGLHEQVPLIRHYLFRQIGLLINKFMPSGMSDEMLELLRYPLTTMPRSNDTLEAAVPMSFWIAKALTLRLESTDEVLEHLLGFLVDSFYGASCARGFGILLAPDEILSKDHGATIRLLCGQKVFSTCIPKLAVGYRESEDTVKPNFLIALSGILKYTPAEIIMTETDTLLPLLLQSLDLEEDEVKAASIEIILVIAQKAPSSVEGHLSSLTGRLLRCATQGTKNSSNVRLNALRCLQTLPGRVRDSAILPFKTGVTRGLLGVLDDRKRRIRKEAVQCKAAWLAMDELDDGD